MVPTKPTPWSAVKRAASGSHRDRDAVPPPPTPLQSPTCPMSSEQASAAIEKKQTLTLTPKHESVTTDPRQMEMFNRHACTSVHSRPGSGWHHVLELLLGVCVHVASHGDDRVGRSLSCAPHHVHAVHARHANVQQHDVCRTALRDERRGLGACSNPWSTLGEVIKSNQRCSRLQHSEAAHACRNSDHPGSRTHTNTHTATDVEHSPSLRTVTWLGGTPSLPSIRTPSRQLASSSSTNTTLSPTRGLPPAPPSVPTCPPLLAAPTP
jgi:hypothetical protein